MHIEQLASFNTGYLSHNFLVMTSIAQLIKASEYASTGWYPVQALTMFLNELIISLSHSQSLTSWEASSPPCRLDTPAPPYWSPACSGPASKRPGSPSTLHGKITILALLFLPIDGIVSGGNIRSYMHTVSRAKHVSSNHAALSYDGPASFLFIFLLKTSPRPNS